MHVCTVVFKNLVYATAYAGIGETQEAAMNEATELDGDCFPHIMGDRDLEQDEAWEEACRVFAEGGTQEEYIAAFAACDVKVTFLFNEI